MTNKVKITMKNVPEGLESMYLKIEETAISQGVRNVLFSGVKPVNGNVVEIDIGNAGTVGAGVIFSADNFTSAVQPFKSMSGYGVIEAVDVPPTGYLIEGERIKVVAFGDSITEQGASQRYGADTSYLSSTRGWWCNSLSISNQDFVILDGRGVSGDTTMDLLARMDDVLLSGAELVLLLIGTNDLNQFRTVAEITTDMANILDQIIAAGMKIIIQPMVHKREDTQSIKEWNDKADQLNASFRSLANDRAENVVIASEPTQFNQVMKDNPILVTNDGTHPTDYGAFLIGTGNSTTINEKVLSTTPAGDINYIPEFIGNGGELRNGATGEMPDLWRLDYANPADGLGGTVNADGSVTIRTGLSSGGTENDSRVFISVADVPAGEYVFSIELTIEDITPLREEFVILLREINYSKNSEHRIGKSSFTQENSMSFLNAKFTTGKLNSISGGLAVEIKGNALADKQLTYTISNPRLIKVG